ncbi:hypothetical protein T439DRAFT_378303 [Meredithblackwellia eburnea MCA 4105]
MWNLPSTLLTLIFTALLAKGYVPATSSSTSYVGQGNATFKGSWKNTDVDSSGVFGGLMLELAAGDGSGIVASKNSSILGVVQYFNESAAEGQNRSSLPFIALVSCDSDTTKTASSSSNSSSNVTATDVFTVAASLNAQAVILYSSAKQSCELNLAYNSSNVSKPLPIYSSPSNDFATVMQEQLASLNTSHIYFNSTLLNQAYQSLISSNSTSNTTNSTSTPTSSTTILANFLNGNISFYNSSAATNERSSPTIATVGHAPSSTGTVRSSGATDGGSSNSGASSLLDAAKSSWTATAFTLFVALCLGLTLIDGLGL